jgi:hypothetical protein
MYVRPWTETASGTLAEVLRIKLTSYDDSKFATAHARRGAAAAAAAAIAAPLPSPIPFHYSSQSVCRASSRNRERPRTILTVPLV